MGKARHRSRDFAERSSPVGKGGLEAYECPVCGFWHTGHRHPGTEQRSEEIRAMIRRMRANGPSGLLGMLVERFAVAGGTDRAAMRARLSGAARQACVPADTEEIR